MFLKRLSSLAVLVTVLSGTVIGLNITSAGASTALPAHNTPGYYYEAHPAYVGNVSTPAYKMYTVKRGNTLSGIAHKFDLNWKKLYCANRAEIGDKPWLIQPRMRIKVKESRHVWCPIPQQSQIVGSNSSSSSGAVYTAPPSQGVLFNGSGGFQSCVIAAESGGNPGAYNNSSGASGLYGDLLSTWLGLHLGYPGGAYTAPVSVQNEGFAKLYAQDGMSPWLADGCPQRYGYYG